MGCVFEISPYDGGWCVKVCDTGEVLFFETRAIAECQAKKMAAFYPGPTELRVRDPLVRAAEPWLRDGPRWDGLCAHQRSQARV